MGDKKGIILILFVCLVSVSFISAWADNTSAYQEVDGCNLLNTTGANYVLTGNVTSTGNCFNITAQNITLDCAGKWITYSTGGAASTYGIYTNQFNSTIKNCNVLDGDWTSLESTRNAIYFDGNDNSTLLNNFVNVSKSSAIYLNSNSNYNNFTFLNVSSNSSFGIYVFLSLDNTFDNLNINSNTSNDISLYMGSVSNCNNTFNNVRGKDGKLIIYINGISSNIDNFDESMLIMCNTNFSNITNSNFTTSGISLYYSNNNNFSNILAGNNLNSAVMIQSSSNNSFRDITTDNINGPGVGINLYSYSNFNIFSNIIANSKSNSGLRLYRSSNNDFSNASISSNSSRGIILEDNCNLNNFSNIDIKSNTGYGVYLISSSNNTLSNVSVSSNTSYGMFVYSSSNFNKLYNLTIISNISNVLYASLNSDSNSVVNSTLISLNNNGTLLYLGSNCNSNLFYGNNFTETSGYYVEDLNGSNYFNTTINSRGEGNIWYDIMNGSVNITGNVSSTLNPSLYIGEYGTGYPYNSTNSFGKISGNVVDYAPLTNNPVPLSCGVLSDAGRTYVLTGNVSSTGTCFTVNAQNITLDCAGNWITYSTGGGANTYGVVTNQFNTTIHNCNVLDGNWTSTQTTRDGIYLDYSNNSLLFNNFVNVSSSNGIKLYYSNFNNLSNLRLYSQLYGVNVNYGFDNHLSYINATGDSGILINRAQNTSVLNSNSTGINGDAGYGYSVWVYNSNYTYLKNINTYAIGGMGIGLVLQQSNYSTISDIYSICTTHSGYFDAGIYTRESYSNNFTNIFSNSTIYSMIIEFSNWNNFSNIEVYNHHFYTEYGGGYFWGSSYNKIINSSISSNYYSGFSFLSNSSFNIFDEVDFISNLNISLEFEENSSSNIVANSTIISANEQENLLDIDSSCGFNTFYGNNFTETSGYYVQDLNGSNYYNTTIAGRGEGNIWNDVMNGSVDIKGNISSTLDSSLYIGEYGTRYPYNNTNSFGKISGNVVDYAPLTNQFEEPLIYPNITFVSPTTSAGNHVQTFITANVSVENASSVVNLTVFLYNSSSGNLISQSSTASNKLFWNITGLNVGNYSLNATVEDNNGLTNSTSTLSINLTAALPEEEPEDPPSSGGGGSTAQVQTQYQLGREFSEQGESLKLRKNYQVGFRHQEESHTLTVNSFTTNTAKITIRSDPITATLEKDIAQSFNIDDEEGTDVEITYQGTSGSEAQFFIKKIVEVSGESEVFANSEGGEVQETNQISTNELFGTSGSGSESVDVAKEKTKRAKNPLRTVLISLIIMGAVIAGLYAIGKNEKKKKDHYLGFFDK